MLPTGRFRGRVGLLRRKIWQRRAEPGQGVRACPRRQHLQQSSALSPVAASRWTRLCARLLESCVSGWPPLSFCPLTLTLFLPLCVLVCVGVCGGVCVCVYGVLCDMGNGCAQCAAELTRGVVKMPCKGVEDKYGECVQPTLGTDIPAGA